MHSVMQILIRILDDADQNMMGLEFDVAILNILHHTLCLHLSISIIYNIHASFQYHHQNLRIFPQSIDYCVEKRYSHVVVVQR